MAPPSMLGESQAAEDLRARCLAAAGSDTTVLLEGPLGSGRETSARFIHLSGRRAGGPFVVVPCAALASSLAESELFGHEKGAFTGATDSHVGLLERASGGTVYFAEVGELPTAIQAKLLRFLEERIVQPIGAPAPRPVDLRVIASTCTDLAELVRSGSFREDLLYRMRVLRVTVPPLVERGRDIELLAEHYLAVLAEEIGRPAPAMTDAARDRLRRHPWPGNVRELVNSLRSALVFARDGRLDAGDLSLEEPSDDCLAGGGPLKSVVARIVRQTEKRLIEVALSRRGGNRTQAALDLGLTRRGLQLKIRRYGLK